MTYSDSADQNCDVFITDYSLHQVGFNSTVTGEGDFDTTLILENADGSAVLYGDSAIDTELILKFETHVQVGGEGSPMPLKTYDSTGLICDLEVIETKFCVQVYEVYAGSYTGIITKVAEITITFRSECLLLDSSLLDFSQMANQVEDYWIWYTPDVLEENYQVGYEVRQQSTLYKMPRFVPQLPSKLEGICGKIDYTVTNPDTWEASDRTVE